MICGTPQKALNDSVIEDVERWIGTPEKVKCEFSKKAKEARHQLLATPELPVPSFVIKKVIASITEVLHFRTSKHSDHEAVRSTLLSSICSPEIDLVHVSKLFKLYQNRN